MFKATKVFKVLMELALKVLKELRVSKVTTVLAELVLKVYKAIKVHREYKVVKDSKVGLVEMVFKVT